MWPVRTSTASPGWIATPACSTAASRSSRGDRVARRRAGRRPCTRARRAARPGSRSGRSLSAPHLVAPADAVTSRRREAVVHEPVVGDVGEASMWVPAASAIVTTSSLKARVAARRRCTRWLIEIMRAQRVDAPGRAARSCGPFWSSGMASEKRRPERTQPAPAAASAASMRFAVPSSSSSPHRPQLETLPRARGRSSASAERHAQNVRTPRASSPSCMSSSACSDVARAGRCG